MLSCMYSRSRPEGIRTRAAFWLEIARFEVLDPVDAAGVAAAFERRLEPDPNDRQGLVEAERPAADGQAVRIVVPARHVGGERRPAGRGPEALELVGRDGHSDPGPAAEDRPVALARLDELGRAGRVLGVIDGLAGAAAEILERDIPAGEIEGDAGLEVVAGVVGGERDLH
jgi:hypothetical protein